MKGSRVEDFGRIRQRIEDMKRNVIFTDSEEWDYKSNECLDHLEYIKKLEELINHMRDQAVSIYEELDRIRNIAVGDDEDGVDFDFM